MTRALLYESKHKRRFGIALAAAAIIHLAAISLAAVRKDVPTTAPGFTGEPTTITFEPPQLNPDPTTDPEPLPTPPVIDPFFLDNEPTPPPLRRPSKTVTPIAKQSGNTTHLVNLASAKVFALSAPRPEYPYEARRQKITGDGIVILTVDPGSGAVVGVSISKSTGNQFLDNAALNGFRRWRFRPGTVSSVTCPVTFTLTGVGY